MILKYVVSFDYLFEMKIEIYVLLQIDINQPEVLKMQWLCYDFKCTIIVSVWLIEKFWCMEKTHTSQHAV